jgi:hypothetical protein
MKHVIALVLAAAAALSIASPALAKHKQCHEGKTQYSANEITARQQLQTEVEKDFLKVDLDGDRKISVTEFRFNGSEATQDATARFYVLDTDGDAKLSSQEIMDYRWVKHAK